MTAKIASMRFHEVRVPAKPGTINSEGFDKPLHMLPVGGRDGWSIQFDQLPKLILELVLDSGVVGYGEFYRDHDWSRIKSVAPAFLGQPIDAFSLQNLPIPLCREHDGFELAVWDAYAKTHDLPLHALLGGKLKDKVKVGAWSSYRQLDEIGPYCRQFQLQGYDCVKFKCTYDDDVEAWCSEIAKHAPGLKVILDPNQRWETAASARERLKALEKIGNVLLLEDPIPRWRLQDYADLRRFSSIPIVLHVSLPYVFQGQRATDAINALEHRAVDGFNFNGGLAGFHQLDAIARTANLPVWHGSEIDLGILEASYVHKAAAAKSCIWPSDIFGRMIREHDLLETPLSFEPPHVLVPEGPGLGVTLDHAAIEKYKTSELELA